MTKEKPKFAEQPEFDFEQKLENKTRQKTELELEEEERKSVAQAYSTILSEDLLKDLKKKDGKWLIRNSPIEAWIEVFEKDTRPGFHQNL